MEDAIHADSLIAENGRDRGGTEDPGAGVPPTGEPAAYATMTSSCDRSPLIHYQQNGQYGVSPMDKSALLGNIPPLEEGMADANSAIDAAISQ